MAKRILVVAASPRKDGNSDLLCERFIEGALEAGNIVEEVFLREQVIGFCRACDYCRDRDGACALRDDAASVLDKMAEALRVDRQNFYTIAPGSAEDFMRTFFWLDEDSPGSIRLFQLVRNPGKTGASDDTAVRYNDTDDWPAQPPVGIYFNYGLVDEFMREWLLRQQELHAGEITREEYFEWKINWPCTCDDSKRFDYYVPWRKEK